MMTRRLLLALAAAARDASLALVSDRELPGGVEYLLARASDASILASRWPHASTPAPPGSVVKPFLTLAYGEGHAFRYPEFECQGCWLARGHGRIGIVSALAESCNSYFLELASATPPDAVERIAARYGLEPPPDSSPDTLIGRYGRWRCAPVSVVRAFSELLNRQLDGGVATVLAGMRLAARSGTASGCGAKAAAKTGTAPCSHGMGAPGDGLAAVLFPGAEPEFILLARAHGTTGAETARMCGRFLRRAA
jgi:cell division protein FtsI/penicillin-binding protein 2